MKRIVLFMVAMFATVSYSYAQDKIYFDDVVISQGGSATLIVNLKSAERKYAGLQCDFTLPAGVTASKITSASRVSSVLDPSTDKEAFTVKMANNTTFYRVLIYNDIKESIPGDDGEVAYITLTADASAALGTYECNLNGITMTTADKQEFGYDEESKFKVTITNRWVFDEKAIVLPEGTGEKDVLVKRTIKAKQWNTICLPFALNEAQVAQAFGDGVQLADFTGCEADYPDEAEYAASIKVKFQTVTTMEANRPYLIKVVTPVTYAEGFEVDGVTIAPVDNPVNAQDENKVKVGGKWYSYYNSFYGTYVANTEIPAGSIILSGNKFYYTKGTKTKGFRGWFSFDNCSLDDIDLATAEAKIYIDDVTAIDGIGMQRIVDGVYDLSGRKIQIEGNDLNKLQKGVYIIDGKKVTIK